MRLRDYETMRLRAAAVEARLQCETECIDTVHGNNFWRKRMPSRTLLSLASLCGHRGHDGASSASPPRLRRRLTAAAYWPRDRSRSRLGCTTVLRYASQSEAPKRAKSGVTSNRFRASP